MCIIYTHIGNGVHFQVLFFLEGCNIESIGKPYKWRSSPLKLHRRPFRCKSNLPVESYLLNSSHRGHSVQVHALQLPCIYTCLMHRMPRPRPHPSPAAIPLPVQSPAPGLLSAALQSVCGLSCAGFVWLCFSFPFTILRGVWVPVCPHVHMDAQEGGIYGAAFGCPSLCQAFSLCRFQWASHLGDQLILVCLGLFRF